MLAAASYLRHQGLLVRWHHAVASVGKGWLVQLTPFLGEHEKAAKN